jgi:hypothetical protein
VITPLLCGWCLSQDNGAETDRRALSPLFWTYVDPYGRFELAPGSRFIRNT